LRQAVFVESRLNRGLRRDRGMVRTSTRRAIPCARSSATKSSSARVEWPTVYTRTTSSAGSGVVLGTFVLLAVRVQQVHLTSRPAIVSIRGTAIASSPWSRPTTTSPGARTPPAADRAGAGQRRLDVGREDRQQEQHQAPGRRPRQRRHEQFAAARDVFAGLGTPGAAVP